MDRRITTRWEQKSYRSFISNSPPLLAGLLLLASLLPLQATAFDTETLFNRKVGSLYQVLVINQSTGEKSSIGSGFVIGDKKLLATNYHVVSSFVHKPDTYTLEYLATDGSRGPLTIMDLDVPHDLAVLRADSDLGTPLRTGPVPEKGAPLFAMGNPHDLGMSLTDGTNNGVMPQSDDGRIHFSGSLNPGMSGGPTLDVHGRVIGINVATAGNNISFVIPSHYLDQILEQIGKRNREPVTDLLPYIGNQLKQQQTAYLKRLMEAQWPKTAFGKFQVPGELSNTIRCWDGSQPPKPNEKYRRLYTRCDNQNDIFLYDHLDVGQVRYEYEWLESEKLSATTFYNLYQSEFSPQFHSKADKEDVTNFHCETRFVTIGEKPWKVNLCRRDYIRYPELSDLILNAAMTGEPKQGMIFNLYLTGTHYESALELIRNFLEGLVWTG